MKLSKYQMIVELYKKRHCEARSNEAVHFNNNYSWIASPERVRNDGILCLCNK